MSNTSTNLLLIFVKNPEKGRVKTRLAETVGSGRALEIYNELLVYTRQVALGVNADKQVWYSRFIPEEDQWNLPGFKKKLQRGSNLGERMKDAFEKSFTEGYRKVVIIGSDCAQLRTEMIEDAFSALEGHDVIIGPSQDGGYYLLGMNTFLPELFTGKPWSTSKVMEQTMEDIKKLGMSQYRLPELNDVDTERDWNQVKSRF